MSEQNPTVTVIIPAYNRSNVLRYAIKTVLWQTYQDFELIVVGDHCTDDSEAVVKSFQRDFIHWHNLPENSGSPAKPNQTGIELAKGKYITYLGQDDLWHPTHLALLVNAAEEQQADVVYPLMLKVTSPPQEQYLVIGLSSSGTYERYQALSASAIMHTRQAALDVGGWRHYTQLTSPSDIEFFTRLFDAGKTFQHVPELTVFNFDTSQRRDIYLENPDDEQREYFQRIQQEPEFRYHELLKVLYTLANNPNASLIRKWRPTDLTPGAFVDAARVRRGLAPLVDQQKQSPPPTPIYEDLHGLSVLNDESDITPLRYRRHLYINQALPRNGLFIGSRWSRLRQTRWGQPYRRPQENAELVVTHPNWREGILLVDLYPSNNKTTVFELSEASGDIIAHISVSKRQAFAIRIPLGGGTGKIFHINAEHENGGRSPGFHIYQLEWVRDTQIEVALANQPEPYLEVQPAWQAKD